MILFTSFATAVVFTVLKLIVQLVIFRFGRFSYDGFEAAGFAYDSADDLFYSTRNAWQRSFGYSYLYDVFAPLFRMIIDTEAIKFFYNNQHWLLCFWKGQYGITTGSEIGIYKTDSHRIDQNTIYGPVNNDEMLNIKCTLYRKKKRVYTISDRHWWLAAFKLGVFSKPSWLEMEMEIEFPNHEMLDAFLEAFERKGYKRKNYSIDENKFYFTFKKPKTKKVFTRSWFSDYYSQKKNLKNVNLYNKYAGVVIETDGIDDSLLRDRNNLILINDLVPKILKNPVEEINKMITDYLEEKKGLDMILEDEDNNSLEENRNNNEVKPTENISSFNNDNFKNFDKNRYNAVKDIIYNMFYQRGNHNGKKS